MKKLSTLFLSLFLLITTACVSDQRSGTAEIQNVVTGVNADAWVKIPAGDFFKGQHRVTTTIKNEYEMMVTAVTNEQYAEFLNRAFAESKVKITSNKVMGFYKGDPFDNFKHEFEIPAGDKVFLNLSEPGIRLKFDGETFTVFAGFKNHPVTFISWFGANAYAEFFGWRLPSENEWEKAARGTGVRTYPWGEKISANVANYMSTKKLFAEVLGQNATTTPVGFFNGQTYSGYKTVDNKSPYGLYDMAGNVWEWVGDDKPDLHYRFMRGGSRTNYEYNLFVWAQNSAGPEHVSMYTGFRCARDVM